MLTLHPLQIEATIVHALQEDWAMAIGQPICAWPLTNARVPGSLPKKILSAQVEKL